MTSIGPFAVCGRCGRITYLPSEFGREDRETQPDGYPCGGKFSVAFGMSPPIEDEPLVSPEWWLG